MFSGIFKKTVLSLLIVSLAVPTALLSYPKKVEAQGKTSCAAVIGGAMATILGLGTKEQATNVPATSGAAIKGAATTAGAGYGQFFKDCVLTPIAIRMAKAMLQNLTTSIVNWINNGFEGNPAFVQDLKGMMTDSMDEAIGAFIEHDLGAGFLCQPFSFQVRIAIAQTYLPYRQRNACTLKDITRNVNGFIDSNNSGGWQYWLDVTTIPQNNVYGATILAQNELSRVITERLGIQNKNLDWGKGFRSFPKCESDAEVTERLNRESTSSGGAFRTSYSKATLNAKRACPTVTPGSVVEGQLQRALNTDISQLEVANDIDAIVGALTNQLMAQVVKGATGLLGVGRKSNGSYNSIGYSAAIAPPPVDNGFTTAIESGINKISTDTDLDGLFVDPEAIDASGSAPAIPEEPTEEGGALEAPTLGFAPVQTNGVLNSFTPFVYEIRIVSNYSATNLNVKTILKRNGSPVELQKIFESIQASYGMEGFVATRSPKSSSDIGFAWEKVSSRKDSDFVIKILGHKTGNALGGNYILETTVIDAQGTILGTEATPFVVQ
jgi:hypothetical protein